MGWDRHHAIIVTGCLPETVHQARQKASTIGLRCTGMVPSPVNSWYTFLVIPDGSKEGWVASDEGDRRRDEFKKWLDGEREEEGPYPVDWVEVQYGDDAGETKLCADSDEWKRSEVSG